MLQPPCHPPSAWAKLDRMGSRLEGRHALITGGGTGIGAAAASICMREGAKLSLLGRRMEPLQAVAEQVGGTPFAVRRDGPRIDPAAFAEPAQPTARSSFSSSTPGSRRARRSTR